MEDAGTGSQSSFDFRILRRRMSANLSESFSVMVGLKVLVPTAMLWVLFLLCQYAHRDTSTLNAMRTAVRTVLLTEVVYEDEDTSATDNATATTGRRLLAGAGNSRSTATSASASLDSISTVPDVFVWMHDVMIPQIWTETKNGRGMVADFNRVIGGVRLSTTRSPSVACPVSPVMETAYNMTCYSSDSSSPFSSSIPGFFVDDSGGEVVWLDLTYSMEEVQNIITILADAKRVSESTDGIKAQTLLLNAQAKDAGLHVSTTFSLSCDVGDQAQPPKVSHLAFSEVAFVRDRTGNVKGRFEVDPMPLVVYESALEIIGDVCLLLLVLVVGGFELHTMGPKRRQSGRGYCTWSAFATFLIVVGGIAFACFFSVVSIKIDGLSEQLGALPPVPDVPMFNESMLTEATFTLQAGWADRCDALDQLYLDMRLIAEMVRWKDLSIFWYSLLLVVKLFEAFEIWPRLAVLTKTLKVCAVDLSHFMIIFTFIFVNFGFGGYFLFGHLMPRWSSVGLSMNSSFRALLGDFEFSEMYAIAPISAVVWFWLYMVIICLIMLNMMLAIILDSYDSVKDDGKEHETVWAQAKSAFRGSLTTMKTAVLRSKPPKGRTDNTVDDAVQICLRDTAKEDDSNEASTGSTECLPLPQNQNGQGRQAEFHVQDPTDLLKHVHLIMQKLDAVASVSSRLDKLEGAVAPVSSRLDKLEGTVALFPSRFDRFEESLDKLVQHVTKRHASPHRAALQPFALPGAGSQDGGNAGQQRPASCAGYSTLPNIPQHVAAEGQAASSQSAQDTDVRPRRHSSSGVIRRGDPGQGTARPSPWKEMQKDMHAPSNLPRHAHPPPLPKCPPAAVDA